jgi:hypothetical protein
LPIKKNKLSVFSKTWKPALSVFRCCSKQTEVAVFRFQALLTNTNSCYIGAFKSQFEALLVAINKSLLPKKYKDIGIYGLFRNSEVFRDKKKTESGSPGNFPKSVYCLLFV